MSPPSSLGSGRHQVWISKAGTAWIRQFNLTSLLVICIDCALHVQSIGADDAKSMRPVQSNGKAGWPVMPFSKDFRRLGKLKNQ
jgi:hypothetical protein